MIYNNTPRLKQFLEKAGFLKLAQQAEFEISELQHRKHLLASHLSPKAHHADIAAFCCLTMGQQPDSVSKPELPIGNTSSCDLTAVQQLLQRSLRMQSFIALLLFLILLLLLTGTAHAQNNDNAIVVTNCQTAPSNYPTSGRVPLTVDIHGNLCGGYATTVPPVTQTWTTATAQNTADTISMVGNEGAYIQVNAGANLTAGVITFEVSDGLSGIWTPILATRTNSTTTETNYTLISNTTQSWFISTTSAQFRVRLSTAITTSGGNGSTTLSVTPGVFPLTGTSSGGGGGSGTSSTYGSSFPGTGTAAGFKIDGSTNMGAGQVDGSNFLEINCKSGCTTASDTVGMAVTFNASTSSASVALAGQRGVIVFFNNNASYQGTVVANVSYDGGSNYNTAQFTNLVGLGGSSTETNPAGGFAILIASGATNASVTTNAYTSGSMVVTLRAVTYNPAEVLFGQDGTFLRPIKTATDGTVRIDPIGTTTQPVSGTVTANQGTGAALSSNWPVQVTDGTHTMPTGDASARSIHTTVDGTAAVTQSGNWTNRIVGNTGAVLDAAGQNAGSPPNEVLTGCQFNTSPTGIMSGNVSPIQCDTNGNVLVNIKGGVVTGYAQASTTSGQLGPLNQAAVTTNPPSYTTGQTDPLSLTTVGALRGDVTSVGGSAFALGQQSIANSLPIIGPAITFNSVQPSLLNGQTEQDFQISTRGALIVNPGTETFNVTVNTALPQGANTIGAVTQASGPWTINHTQTAGVTLGATAISNFGSAPQAANVDAVNASLFAGTTGITATGSSMNVACTSGCSASSPQDTVGSAQILSGLNNTASVVLAGQLGVLVEFTINTSAAFTVVAEVSPDAGSNWLPAVFFDPVSGAMSTSIVNPTAPTYFQIGYVGAATQARVRVSAFTSGSITAQLRATTTRPYVMNYGSDGTNMRPITTTTGGLTKVDLSGTAANGTSLNVAVTNTPAVTISGQPVNVNWLTANPGVEITDGTNTATVKAANIGAVGADKALVVAISPNNNLPVNVIQFGSTAVVTAVTGGLTTTAGGVVEVTQPSGLSANTYRALSMTPAAAVRVATGSDTFNVTVNAALPAGANTIGAVTGTLGNNGNAGTTNRIGTLPAIAQSQIQGAVTAGRDVSLQTDKNQILMVGNQPIGLPVYSSATTASMYASPTDVFSLAGNGTNTVLLEQVIVTCTQTTAGIIDIQLRKRTTADTGGSPTTITSTQMDGNDSASSSSLQIYTAAPTIVNGGTTIDAAKVGAMATGTASPNDIYVWNAAQFGRPLVLRGTAQQAVINFGGTAITGLACSGKFVWEEVTNYN